MLCLSGGREKGSHGQELYTRLEMRFPFSIIWWQSSRQRFMLLCMHYATYIATYIQTLRLCPSFLLADSDASYSAHSHINRLQDNEILIKSESEKPEKAISVPISVKGNVPL